MSKNSKYLYWLLVLVPVAILIGVTGFLSGWSTLNPVDAANAIAFNNLRLPNVSDDVQVAYYEKTSDSFGAFTRTYLSVGPNFHLNDGSIPTGEAKQALDAAVKFASLEAVDSIALDNPARVQEWNSKIAPQWIVKSSLSKVLNPQAGTAQGPIIWSASPLPLNAQDSKSAPQMMRDGGLRIGDKLISTADVKVVDDLRNKIHGYNVALNGSALAYSTDEKAISWADAQAAIDYDIALETQMNADGTRLTKEQAKARLSQSGFTGVPVASEYLDGNDNALVVNFGVSLMMVQDGGEWKILSGSTIVTNTRRVASGNSALLGGRKSFYEMKYGSRLYQSLQHSLV